MAKGKVEVRPEYCKGCALCISVCPAGSLAISEELGPLGVHPAKRVEGVACRLCRNCIAMCPDAAIILSKED